MAYHDEPVIFLPEPDDIPQEWIRYWLSIVPSYFEANISIVEASHSYAVEKGVLKHLITKIVECFSGTASPFSQPIIDLMMLELFQKVQTYYNVNLIWKPKFKFLLTFDIDIPYQFRGRRFYKHLFALVRDIAIRPKFAFKRLSYFITGEDPFDNIAELVPVLPEYVFIYIGDGKAPNDPRFTLSDDQWSTLISAWKRVASVHWHPSLCASSSFNSFQTEFRRWLKVSGKKREEKVRFHYLNIDIQKHGLWLEKLGIREDFSYGSYRPPFFKAGTTLPFKPFYLRQQRPFNFVEHPVVAMDVSFTELTEGPYHAIELLKQLIEQVKQVGGTFQMIIHPEKALGLEPGYKKWLPFYNFVFRLLQEA